MSGLKHRIITREEVIRVAQCPNCGSKPGILCLSFKKKLPRREMVHRERYDLARRIILS